MSRNESLRTTVCVRAVACDVQKQRTHPRGAWAWRVASLILLAFNARCDDAKAAERSEARTLLSQLTALSDEHSLRERSDALERLQRLPLRVPAHLKAREACRSAQLGLLEAETAQATARKTLSEASAQQQPGGTLSPNQAQAIAADIERSNRALAEAKARFPACEKATRELLTKAH
jgi:hypothetical protein